MKDSLIISLFLLIALTIPGLAAVESTAPDINYTVPTQQEIKTILDRILDHLERVTPYRVYDSKTGETINDFNQVVDARVEMMPGKHRIWSYEMGVAYSAMVLCTQVTGDSAYLDYAEKTYQFVADRLDYCRKANEQFGYHRERLMNVMKPQHLDDCGSMGAALVRVHDLRPDERYRLLLDIISHYILKEQVRLKDGTLARPAHGDWEYTLWTDDMYMSIPFLVQMGKLTNDHKYYDEAIRQVLQFAKYLFIDGVNLFDHAWYSHVKYDPHFFWGRQNGWALMAMVEVLSVIPDGYPGRDKVLDIFQRNVRALIELQGRNGLWHQLLDKEETYLETSCTAMFTFCIARGVNRGWLENVYGSVAQAGWRALERKVTEDGQIEGVCGGTNVANDMVYYANRPQSILAYHGYGPVISAGAEMIQLLKNFEVKSISSTFQYWRR